MAVNLKILVTLSALPFSAFAQTAPANYVPAPPTVPAIRADATASASVQGQAAAPTMNLSQATNQQKIVPPDGWPPAMSATVNAPAVQLDNKAKTAVGLSTVWRDRSDRPVMMPDGVLRWIYGRSQPRVVCAPLNICDVELQAGETINNVHVGDLSFWSVKLAVSGSPEGRVTHVIIKPYEAGHTTSMLIYTDQRTYTLELTSAERNYTVRTGFTYPDTAVQTDQSIMAGYRATIGSNDAGGGSSTSAIASIEVLRIDGDNPAWRPTAYIGSNHKTYIQFPRDMQFSDAPVLLGLNNDAGFFSGPSERRVIYRWLNNKIVVDTVMDKMELILGVGGSQKKVIISRQHA